MPDLAAINGPWQAVTFLNFYLTEYNDKLPDCTVILYEMDDELKSICRSILSKYNFIESTIDYSQIRTIKRKTYNNLWIGKLFSDNPKVIADNFSQLPIILFEEGIHSYIKEKYFGLPALLNDTRPLLQKLRVIWKFFFRQEQLVKKYNHFVLPSHEKRCRKKYYLLPLAESGNAKAAVSNKHINLVLKNAEAVLQPAPVPGSGKRRVLITGQCFSNYDLLGFEEELDIYCKIVQYYLNEDFAVFWKGHPRNKLFDAKIKETFGDRVYMLNHNALPLEISIHSNPDIELCGISSSALLYHSCLFKREARQATGLIINRLNKECAWYKDFVAMFSFVRQNVQELNL